MPPGNENSASLEGQNALRVKVAELCPDLFDVAETSEVLGATKFVCWKNGPEIEEREWLAACAEFEKGLTPGQRQLYYCELRQLKGTGMGISATAEQRCRAFIAVKEGKEK